MQVFLNARDSNTRNIFKDIFNIPTTAIHETQHMVVKKVLTLQEPVRSFKNNPEYLSKINVCRVTKFYEILISYQKAIKQNKPRGGVFV